MLCCHLLEWKVVLPVVVFPPDSQNLASLHLYQDLFDIAHKVFLES